MKVYAPIDVLPTAEFYARESEFLRRVVPSYEDEEIAGNLPEEQQVLAAALGPAEGRALLDVTCGNGNQALALASMGWQVTGLDLTPEYLDICAGRARAMNLDLRLAPHDITCPLPDDLRGQFDVVISCMALDNLASEDEVLSALEHMRSGLKPGGLVYIRLRDMDFILDEEAPVTLGDERKLPNGKLIRAEHFLPLDDGGVVHSYYYFLEDHSTGGYPNFTTILSQRRLALRRAKLLSLMAEAGLGAPRLLERDGPWCPYELIAGRDQSE